MTSYDSWRQVPAHLRTRTQLADLDLPRTPGAPPVAEIATDNAIGRRAVFDLYDANASRPTPAGAAGLEAAAARRTATRYDCEDCGAHTESPATAHQPRPRPRHETTAYLCRACLHIARLREAQADNAAARERHAAAAQEWLRADAAAVVHVETIAPPPAETGRKRLAVALSVTALTPGGRALAALAIRLNRSRSDLVPGGALDPDTALAQLRETLTGRDLITWQAGDLDPVAPALLPPNAPKHHQAAYWAHRTVIHLSGPATVWRGEIDPRTRQPLIPLPPGTADRTALLIRRMAATHTARTGAVHPSTSERSPGCP